MNTAIDVSNLSKRYGEIMAVSNFSVKVNQGEVFGLLGANGAGKSTAIECMLGTKRADSGMVSILDIDPKADRKNLYEQVSVQFQENCYQDRIQVGELCEVTASLYKQPHDYHDFLKKFGLADKKKSLVSELSGGQKQRLFVLLALIPNPNVVFLDELTTGLDVKARREIWKYLRQLKETGVTIFLTSHFMDEVEELCDRICILKRGETIFMGTPAQAVEESPHDNLEDAYLWYTNEEDEENENI